MADKPVNRITQELSERLYGGWWDANPARLKPARDADLAQEVASIAGGAGAVASGVRGESSARGSIAVKIKALHPHVPAG